LAQVIHSGISVIVGALRIDRHGRIRVACMEKFGTGSDFSEPNLQHRVVDRTIGAGFRQSLH